MAESVPKVYWAILILLLMFKYLSGIQSNSSYWRYIYPPDDQLDGTKSIYFGLILSFPESQFDSFGAVAGVRVALDRINSDPYLLQNYTLRYTLSDSKVHMYSYNVMFKNHTITIIVFD